VIKKWSAKTKNSRNYCGFRETSIFVLNENTLSPVLEIALYTRPKEFTFDIFTQLSIASLALSLSLRILMSRFSVSKERQKEKKKENMFSDRQYGTGNNDEKGD
jgi:hypothetical protein